MYKDKNYNNHSILFPSLQGGDGGRLKKYNMKKEYLTPQTEVIQLLSENVIMANSGGPGGPIDEWGEPTQSLCFILSAGSYPCRKDKPWHMVNCILTN